MHAKSPLPRSVRKYIRAEKALIRKTASNQTMQKEAIEKLYSQFQSYKKQ